MSINYDFVSCLPPHESSGCGRDELLGNAVESVQLDLFDDVVVRPSKVKMVGICRTCGNNISSERFFNGEDRCFGC